MTEPVLEPGVEPLVDSFGRVHRDLRISVTDRCNFRCTYCMPAEGMTWLARSELLDLRGDHPPGPHLRRAVRHRRHPADRRRADRAGPPARAGRQLHSCDRPGGEPVDLALTTNGATLALIADDLARAGLRRINVSFDSLRPERFAELTRRDALPAVLDGIDAAQRAGLDPVKVNVVVMRGVNDDEIVDFAAFGRDQGVIVRFIEFMPLDAQGAWTPDQVVRQDEIVAAIDAVLPARSRSAVGATSRPSATATSTGRARSA